MAESVKPLIPSSTLACQSFEFMTLWDKVVKPGCQAILNKPFEPVQVMTLYSAVYRLASNPCTKVPVLIRGSQNEKVETRDMTAQQCLVLYYLLREMLKEHLERVVMNADGPLRREVTVVAQDKQPTKGAKLVKVYVDEFFKMTESLRKLKSVFNYLQNHWHTLHMHNTNIFFNVMSMGLNMWNDHVLVPIKEPLSRILVGLYFNTILDTEEQYANEDDPVSPNSPTSKLTASQRLLKDTNISLSELDQYVSHSMYKRCSEDPILKEVAKRSNEKTDLPTDDLYQLLSKVNTEVDLETERANHCVMPTTVGQIRVVMLDEFVIKSDRLSRFLSVAMDVWLVGDSPNVKALSLLHRLLQHSVVGMKALRDRFVEKMHTHGKVQLKSAVESALANNLASKSIDQLQTVDYSFIDVLIRVSRHFHKTADEAFPNDTDMKKAVEEGTHKLVNANGICDSATVEQCLARYLHRQLVNKHVSIVPDTEAHVVNTSAAHSTQTFDAGTEMLLRLVMFADKKDAFHTQFHQDLSRRLLYFGGVNTELEKAIVTKIGRMGTREFVHRYDMMIREYESSSFASPSFSISAFAHYWPWRADKSHLFSCKPVKTHPGGSLVMPKLEPKTSVTKWIPGISFAVLQTNPKYFTRGGVKRPLDVTLSHLQTMILLEFRDASIGFKSFADISHKLSSPDDASDVVRVVADFPYLRGDVVEAVLELYSMRLIAAEPNRQITASNLAADPQAVRFTIDISFNPDERTAVGAVDAVDLFTNKALFPQNEGERVTQILSGSQLSVQSAPTGAGVSGQVTNGALKDAVRSTLIQTHIMKIVKDAGSIAFEVLTDKVAKGLKDRFEASVVDIKAEMEKLIDKDFLERDPTNSGVIRHQA